MHLGMASEGTRYSSGIPSLEEVSSLLDATNLVVPLHYVGLISTR